MLTRNGYEVAEKSNTTSPHPTFRGLQLTHSDHTMIGACCAHKTPMMRGGGIANHVY